MGKELSRQLVGVPCLGQTTLLWCPVWRHRSSLCSQHVLELGLHMVWGGGWLLGEVFSSLAVPVLWLC